MATFGTMLRRYRLRAGLGLRTFAGLIDQRASTVSAIESLRRAPWRHEGRLHRVADVLGLAESSDTCRELHYLARQGAKPGKSISHENSDQTLLWWWATEGAPPIENDALAELASFVGATFETTESPNEPTTKLPALTELAIEWRVRRLLGRRNSLVAAGPVDVESVLENQAEVRLEIVPGLVPRFSVQACVVKSNDGMTIFLDRIVGDSRPLAFYRRVLAECYAPAALWDDSELGRCSAAWFQRLQASDDWPNALRDCERFALAMLLPANPMLAGAEAAYRELIEQQGWVDAEIGARVVRNRVAEQFAVSPTLVHRRMAGWPSYLYERIAQALAAQESMLPPADWITDENAPRQRTLFDAGNQQPV